jgi:hypothetical protein
MASLQFAAKYALPAKYHSPSNLHYQPQPQPLLFLPALIYDLHFRSLRITPHHAAVIKKALNTPDQRCQRITCNPSCQLCCLPPLKPALPAHTHPCLSACPCHRPPAASAAAGPPGPSVPAPQPAAAAPACAAPAAAASGAPGPAAAAVRIKACACQIVSVRAWQQQQTETG